MKTKQAIADRNVEHILDAAEGLLRSGRPLTFSAVAAEASVSRPTVYAHFQDRRRLLAALVARAGQRATAAMRSADPERGAPAEALRRVVAASWEELARHQDVAHAVASEVPAAVLHAGHQDALALLAGLLRRGRQTGAFRSDLPVDWLVTCCVALIHAAVGSVSGGQMDAASARRALVTTLEDLCTPS